MIITAKNLEKNYFVQRGMLLNNPSRKKLSVLFLVSNLFP
ncbi:hypothetical protein HMPREF9171_2129 [Streptococcus agalactiae ATCC 13813]|nr:hypothetical protein HMPREF9171_2129 [Streptococcus agalactiae ATCC 13813]